jgi:hypothetical protein
MSEDVTVLCNVTYKYMCPNSNLLKISTTILCCANRHSTTTEVLIHISMFRSFLGPTFHSAFKGYRGLVPKIQSGRGFNVTSHIHVVPRLRTSGGIRPLPHKPSWRGHGIIYNNKMRNPATAYSKCPRRSNPFC